MQRKKGEGVSPAFLLNATDGVSEGEEPGRGVNPKNENGTVEDFCLLDGALMVW